MFSLLAFAAIAVPQEPKSLPPLEMFATVPAPVNQVWDAFTTTEGVKKWMVAQADLDTRIGGKWRTKYGPEGHLGDDGTIVNEVLALDPGHMFSIRIHTPPKGFPFPNVYRDMWTVVYFDATPNGQTKLTLRAHGFKDTEESKKMRAFFEKGNQYTFDMLVKHFQK